MQILYIVILFILWTMFGSLWGVLISRKWDKDWIKSIFFGRSKCTKCKKTLWFLELVPVLSFLFQKWKCKSCGAKMTHFYWIVELLVWVMFVLTYLFFPYDSIWELIFWIVINRGLLLLMIFDIQKYELHTPIWIFVTVVSLVFAFLKFDIVILLETILLYVIVFLSIYVFSKYYMRLRFRKKDEWFGQWDIFLSLTIWALSWFVFYYSLVEFSVINLINLILIYVILSCLVWLIYALINSFLSAKHKQIIPFLPAMILAFWAVLLFGDFFIGILQ